MRALEQKFLVQNIRIAESAKDQIRFIANDKMTIVASQTLVCTLLHVHVHVQLHVIVMFVSHVLLMFGLLFLFFPDSQVYKLEPHAYDIQVQQLVLQKHFELALELAVSRFYSNVSHMQVM